MKNIVIIFLLSLCNVMAWGDDSVTPQPPQGYEPAPATEGCFTPDGNKDVKVYYKITDEDNKEVSVFWVDRDDAENIRDIVIPEKVTCNQIDYTVVSIGDGAFRGYGIREKYEDGTETGNVIYITLPTQSVTLPATIKNIGKYAFNGIQLRRGLIMRSPTLPPTVDTGIGKRVNDTGDSTPTYLDKKIEISVPIEMMWEYENNTIWNRDAIITNALVKTNPGSNWISVCSYKPLVCSTSNSFTAFKALRMSIPTDGDDEHSEPENNVMLKIVSYIPEKEGIWIHKGRWNQNGFDDSSAEELSIPIYIEGGEYGESTSIDPAPMGNNLFVGSWKSPTEESVVTINGASGYTDFALSKYDDNAHSTANLSGTPPLGFCKAILRMPDGQLGQDAGGSAKPTTLTMFVLDGSDVTGMTPAFKYDINTDKIYSINGMPLPANSKGLQIVNGKKVVVK